MSALTVNQMVAVDGLIDPTPEAAGASGDTFKNDGKTCLRIDNGSGAQRTITIDAVTNCNQGFDHNGGGTIETGITEWFGPFPVNRFGSNVQVDTDAEASVTITAFRL